MIWNDSMLYPSASGVNYLCFTANTAGSTVALNVVGTPTQGQAFEYSTDAENWSEYVPGTTGAITLASVGDKVYFRGDNTTVSESESIYYQFAMTGSIAGSGSIMTLLDKTDALRDLSLKRYCFVYLFASCKSLLSTPELPATMLGTGCYKAMFRWCSEITSAPELPATSLASECYMSMFLYCQKLTSAPELPAIALARKCYYFMLGGCTSLTSAPELPATSLATECYRNMFAYSSRLAYIKLAYTGTFTSAPTNAFTSWVDGVAASGDFYYNGTDTTTGVSAIPSGWTVHTF